MFYFFWIASTAIVFFLLFLIFNLDEKYAYGSTRELVEDKWVLFLILSVIPFIQLIVALFTFVIFIIIWILEMMDDYDLDGEEIMKKIFFIKDGKN